MQAWFERLKIDFTTNFIKANRWEYLVDGLEVTLLITLLAGLLGIAIGVVIAVIRSTYDKTTDGARPTLGRKLFGVLNGICRVYLTVLRGTPVVVQLMIIYFVIFASSDNGVMVAALAFGLNSAAYVAEIIRGGIMSIDNGQFEAGRSLGFNYVQTMRFVIIPQTIKNVLPSLANEFIALLKETSVAGYVAVQDLTRGAYIIQSRTYSPFLPLLAVAAIYLMLVMFFTRMVGKLEKRLRDTNASAVRSDKHDRIFWIVLCALVVVLQVLFAVGAIAPMREYGLLETIILCVVAIYVWRFGRHYRLKVSVLALCEALIGIQLLYFCGVIQALWLALALDAVALCIGLWSTGRDLLRRWKREN